jgi:hypothetical protein
MLMTKLGGGGGNTRQGGGAAPPKDLTGNLPADQLHQMFPTPPSHEHPNIASPAEMMLADTDLSYHGGQSAAGLQVMTRTFLLLFFFWGGGSNWIRIRDPDLGMRK